MEKSGYAAFIDQCRDERASLMGTIHMMEDRKLGVGTPITIPAAMNHATVAAVASMRRTVAELDALIAAYEAKPDA